MTTAHENVCQHCGRAVRWSRTEHGFAGFVHEDTDRAECATTTTPSPPFDPLFQPRTKAELDELVHRLALNPRFREKYTAWKAAQEASAEA